MQTLYESHQESESMETAMMEETLDAAKAQVVEGHRAMTERARAAVQATDTYVHENPWGPIAMGAGVGLLLGWLVARR
jgi:ElaB/YqjD/DUF883 family membrane-anchored ribosome-binding protein